MTISEFYGITYKKIRTCISIKTNNEEGENLKLLIVGAGGHGRVVKEIAEAVGEYETIDFVDDNNSEAVGKISDLRELRKEYDAAFIGIGNNKLRCELIEEVANLGYEVPVLVHPTAYVSKSVALGKGTLVEPKAVVNANSTIGNGCIVSVGAIIDHNVTIEDCVHANSGSIIKAGAYVQSFNRIDAGEVVSGY